MKNKGNGGYVAPYDCGASRNNIYIAPGKTAYKVAVVFSTAIVMSARGEGIR
jgi:hypothetical protein